MSGEDEVVADFVGYLVRDKHAFETFLENKSKGFIQRVIDVFESIIAYISSRVAHNKAIKSVIASLHDLAAVAAEAVEKGAKTQDGKPRQSIPNPYGGNSGYIGYSMSKRAAEAREEGRYPKTDFKKVYDMPQVTLDALVEAGVINDKEWHHTSVYGNKTTFYGWGAYGEYPYMSEYYKAHKAEIDEAAKNHRDLTPFLDGFREFEADEDANNTFIAKLKAQVEAEREEQRRKEESLFQKRIEELKQEIEDSKSKRAYVEANLPAEFVASNGVTIKPKGYGEYPAYRGDEAITSASSSNKRKAASKARAEFKEQIVDPLEKAYASQGHPKFSLQEVNTRFNEELATLTDENKDKVILSLGTPSKKLLAGGVTNKPMKLYGAKVIKKQKLHGFNLSEIKDLPLAVANPIAVFNNYQSDENRSVLTELTTKDGNFLVSLNVGKGEDIDFNIVATVFGKGDDNIVDWFNRGLATYIDKEKALDYLHHSALNAEALSNPRLISTANIIQNFPNPNISTKFSLITPEMDADYLAAVNNGDMETAQRIVEMFGDTKVVMPSNVVTPSLRTELEKLRAEGKTEEADALVKLNKGLAEAVINNDTDDYGNYQKLMGEVEARNVSARYDMTSGERLNTLLSQTEDVAREDQIFLRDGVEMAMEGKKKSADETVSPNNSDHPAAISSADRAKILKNIDNLAKKYQEKSNRPDTFIGDMADALGIEMPNKSSKYRTYKTISGDVVTIRLSNHGATASKIDLNKETNAASIVIAKWEVQRALIISWRYTLMGREQ